MNRAEQWFNFVIQEQTDEKTNEIIMYTYSALFLPPNIIYKTYMA